MIRVNNEGAVEERYEKFNRLMSWLDMPKRIGKMASRLKKSEAA